MAGNEPPASPARAHSVTLPHTFANSFYSSDYRTGFLTLYDQLESGIVEGEEVVATVRQRILAEKNMADQLYPPALAQNGFAQDDGASLKLAYESVLTASVAEARARLHLATELERTIAQPYEEWSASHAGRIRSSRATVESHLQPYEKKYAEVVKLKTAYDEACRTADSYEDEIAFLKGHNPTAATRQRADSKTYRVAPGMSRSSSTSDAGLDDFDDDSIIPRSGGTGSITAALGRALTLRPRKPSASKAADPANESNGSLASPAGLDWSKNTLTNLMDRVAGPQTIEAKYERARKDADLAEQRYQNAVEEVEALRLRLEECLAQHYSYVQRCELDRLRAAASALKSFHASVATLPKAIMSSLERANDVLKLVQPEKDIAQTVERLRTGPFHPRPITFQSHYSEAPIHNFGMRLQHWAETAGKDKQVPAILDLLLERIQSLYPKVDDSEKRKAWLYETPLQSQHLLRAALNHVGHINEEALAQADLPIVCSVVKLWLLELDVPPIVFSQYEEYRTLYPKRVGAEVVEVPPKIIADHVARLPPAHLEVLRRIVCHFHELVTSTETPEPRDVYLQKLALSVSRCLVRPKHDTPLTHDDRFPQLLFIDLVNHCQDIFKYADELKAAQRDDRYKPRRQRTKLVDQRISRSRLGVAQNETVDPDLSVELRKDQLSSPPPVGAAPSPQQATSGQLAAVQKQDEGAFAASPMDMHAPELPKPESATATETGKDNDESPASQQDEFTDAPQAPDAAQNDKAEQTSPVELSEATQVKADPDQPLQASKGGSLSRSTRVRGARGPRPLSVAAGSGAGEEQQRSASFNKARQAFEDAN